MNSETLKRHFGAIGARLEIETPADARLVRRRIPAGEDFVLDVREDRRGETFTLLVRPDAEQALELTAVDVRPGQRHLLLLAKREDGSEDKRRFLCGHDERHWFVAPVPDTAGISRVEDAMEALKPWAVRNAQRRAGVRRKDINRRHNAGFIRQGEWFFIPAPDFAPEHETLILRDEPIQRGGKPHMVEQLYRIGGEVVYVCGQRPNGLNEASYRALLARDRRAQKWAWQVMRRNPTVYAKGRVRHPDHATITLPFWHLVQLSAEQRMANVAFLD